MFVVIWNIVDFLSAQEENSMSQKTNNRANDEIGDEDNVIKSLLMLEALKKTRNARQVVINELRRISDEAVSMEDKCVFLAAADLLSEQS